MCKRAKRNGVFFFFFVELKEGKNVEANLTSKSVSKVFLLFNNIIQEWRGPQPFPEVSLELSLGTLFLLYNQRVLGLLGIMRHADSGSSPTAKNERRHEEKHRWTYM